MTLKTRPVLVAVRTADGDPPPSGTTCTAELTIVGYTDGIVVSPYKVTIDVPEDGDCLFELTPNEILENGSQYVFSARRGRTVYLADIYATLPDGDEDAQVTLDEIVNLPIYPPNPSSTDSIAEGSTNKYFTAARVRDVLLTGLSTATGGVIAATDTILAAFGKLQNQISSGGGGGGVWGAITGTLSNQTDLNNALAAKAPIESPTFTGTVSGITKAMVGLTNVEDKSSATIRGEITSGNVTSALGFTPADAASLGTAAALAADADGTLAANSDTRLATQKAVKTYADQLIAAADVMVFKGVVDCSANPNYPAGDAGWLYVVTVAGKIGGASGVNVEANDRLLCLVDGTVSGTQAAVGASWSISQGNADGIVIGPTSSVDNRVAFFDGTSGKLIKDSGLTLSGNNTGDQDLSGLQPVDEDLTAISGLSPSNDDVLQRKAGAWTNRTPAQVKADLVIVPGDIGMTGVALVGRGTTGAGAGEEIIVGSGLSLSGSTLSTSGGSFDPASPGAIGGTTPAAGTFTTLLVGNGSATAPSLGWTSDADGTGTGFFRSSADVIGYSINGTQRGTLDASGLFAVTADGNALFGRRAFNDRTGFAATGITGGGNAASRLDFTINFQAPAADYDPSNFILTGQAARTTATTNITGGDLSFIGGAGASSSTAAAAGGNLYLDGGQGYGSGAHGDIYIGNTRGKTRVMQDAHFSALTYLGQFPNATEPSYVNGAFFFNTDLDKIRVGGASGWETVTST